MGTQSLINMNNHVLCAIDVETTGTDPYWNELIQISCIPLDSNITLMPGCKIFNMKIRPKYKDRIDWAICDVTKREMQEICDTGMDSDKVLDYFEHWFTTLDLGIGKKLIPLGHNYAFDRTFIQHWMGTPHYENYFHGFSRCTMLICNYLNDRSDVHGEQVMFPKLGLRDCCKRMNIPVYEPGLHDSLYDAQVTAQLYKKLLWELIPQ